MLTPNRIGATPYFDSSGDANVKTIKDSAGLLCFLEVRNSNLVDCWIQLFDHASPTVGVTTPVLSLFIPAGITGKSGGMDKLMAVPLEFATAIKYACTITPTGSTGPAVGLTVNAAYG